MTPTAPLPLAPTQPVVAGPRLLQAITLRNLLSFGPETACLPLGSLNVLVGPNGSGKSNLLEAIALLRGSPNDIHPIILRGGGIGEWIWKGNPSAVATLDAVIANPDSAKDGGQPLRHVLSFRAEQQTFGIEDERIENEQPDPGQTEPLGLRADLTIPVDFEATYAEACRRKRLTGS